MLTLDDLVERLRHAAEAEFAFALTFDAGLVTLSAPQQMPESGRKLLVSIAEDLVGKRNVGFLCLPRSELVPFGGPGPVEVSYAVAASERIICVVSTTSVFRHTVRAAMEAHLPVIEAYLAPPDAPDAAPHIEVRAPVAVGDETIAAINLESLRQEMRTLEATKTSKLGLEAPVVVAATPKHSDQPTVTMVAAAQLESITQSDTSPRIVVEPVRKLGRETLAAIALDAAVEGAPATRPVIPRDLRRKTMPWIDPTIVGRSPKS